MLEIIISVMWLLVIINLPSKYPELLGFNWIILENMLKGNTFHLLS
jgi:hypothetical protein